MCLGVPARIVAVDEMIAIVDCWGVRRQVRLDLLDVPVVPGDYIVSHIGLAIRRIPADDVDATLELYEALLAAANSAPDGAPLGSAGGLPQLDSTAESAEPGEDRAAAASAAPSRRRNA